METEFDEITEIRRRRDELAEKRAQVESELEDRSATIEDLNEEREALSEKSERLEEEVEELRETKHDGLFNPHKEANRIKVEIENERAELADLDDEIESVEAKIEDTSDLDARRDAIDEELADPKPVSSVSKPTRSSSSTITWRRFPTCWTTRTSNASSSNTKRRNSETVAERSRKGVRPPRGPALGDLTSGALSPIERYRLSFGTTMDTYCTASSPSSA